MSNVNKWFEKMNNYYKDVDSIKLKDDLETAGFISSRYQEEAIAAFQEVACSIETEDEDLIDMEDKPVAIKV
ncbi:hypothetical protein [Aquibacillus salsiterrae]|uniref:Uncharacterized protein n=1 Tax=Aquibacillus salsiterrae TaxID=2950439 RepID=A0A9X3WHK7_9BACI|nr:hypothetical protein [Aquibacillus salsiterrae]MDC3418743.1 hypothetical protein [Aquibacillus salsiterrae]